MLGDFGLVFHPDGADPRWTDVSENVGSRDWMPGWAMSGRIEEVKATFDVFSLGKILWSLVSGKRFLRLWYFEKPEFDLERMFPTNPAILWAKRILRKSVVEYEADCLKNAGELLKEVDIVLEALRHGAETLSKDLPTRCWVCGIGSYNVVVRDDSSEFIRACGHCGHAQIFNGVRSKPAWR